MDDEKPGIGHNSGRYMNRSSVEDTKSKPLYNLWSGMINRCHAPWQTETTGCSKFLAYGGHGVMVSYRWRYGDGDKTGYDCFVEDMGPRPSPKHSIDRIDNDGNYVPGNCRWATKSQQSSNIGGNKTYTPEYAHLITDAHRLKREHEV